MTEATEHIKARILKHPVVVLAGELADEIGVKVSLVGGLVRDMLMERPLSPDYDLVCDHSAEQLCEMLAAKLGGVTLARFRNFGTFSFHYKNDVFEFIDARKEYYHSDSRKPIVSPGSLMEDKQRRDFTINAISISINAATFGEMQDPFRGEQDIQQRTLRTPLDPDITFSDDPLRMFRAIRFACQLNFRIDGACQISIQKNAHRIGILSKERITDELQKIVASNSPAEGFILMEKLGLLQRFFPEFVALKGIERRGKFAHKDNFYHTLEVLTNVANESQNIWLRWAALLHDIAKPPTKRFDPRGGFTFHGHEFLGSKMVPKIFRSLGLPMGEPMKYVQLLVLLHLRPIVLSKDEVTDSAVRRLLFDAGEHLEDLLVLCQADITTKNDHRKERYLQNYALIKDKLVEVEEKDRIRDWQPPISGGEIMAYFQLKPGKIVGELKNAIREAILEGEIPNEKDAAWVFLRQQALAKGISEPI